MVVETNEGNPVEIVVYILPRLKTGVLMLIGNPGLRSLVNQNRLQISYKEGTPQAVIGTVEEVGEPLCTIDTSDCKILQFPRGESFEWHFQWKWKSGEPPPYCLNRPGVYQKRSLNKNEIASAVSDWRQSDIIEPCEAPKYMIPLNPVGQDKPDHPVRITGDFEQFNKHIHADSTEAENEVCSEAIQRLRHHERGFMMDLSKAYQSVFLSENLRDYNSIFLDGEWFRAKRMIFGIGIGQKVLYLILKHLLGNTSISYRDDLFIPDSSTVDGVKDILQKNGFRIKPNSTWKFEDLLEGDPPRRVLGLMLSRINGTLHWCRPDLGPQIMKTAKDVASVLGAAASSHLPCVGPVRGQVSLLRSMLGKYIGGEQTRWKLPAPGDIVELVESTRKQIKETRQYQWLIPTAGTFRLYTDASSVLIGGIIRMVEGGSESDDIEDFAAIAKGPHINVSELDGVILGIQYVEKYAKIGASIEIVTDSKSCFAWVECAIRDGIIRTKAQNKSLITHRVRILKETFKQNQWKVQIRWVPSAENPADPLTRVPAKFIEAWKFYHGEIEPDLGGIELHSSDTRPPEEEPHTSVGLVAEENWDETIRKYHERHLHPGVSATLAMLKHNDIPNLNTRVRRVIADCSLCRRKRPAIRFENLKTGHPQASAPWQWCQIDTLSVSHNPPLKLVILIDEYSRWIECVATQGTASAKEVIRLLQSWWSRYKPTPPFHIRSDRGTEFKNQVVAEWIRSHGGFLHLSTVRRPTACGMVERVNRTLLTLMRTAKHMYPEEEVRWWANRAVWEYWNRPHTALPENRTPREMLRSLGTYSVGQDLVDDLPEEDELHQDSDDSEDEIHPMEEVHNPHPSMGEENALSDASYYTPDSEISDRGDTQNGPNRVLAFLPQEEKLDLAWTPAEVVGTSHGAYRVRPEGHRETILNQRWIQPIGREPSPTDHPPDETPSIVERSATPNVRRSQRTRKIPARYM